LYSKIRREIVAKEQQAYDARQAAGAFKPIERGKLEVRLASLAALMVAWLAGLAEGWEPRLRRRGWWLAACVASEQLRASLKIEG
jgi:hypothetical protein